VFLKYKDEQKVFVEETTVEFVKLEANEISEYVATPEPYDKAGGYAIQGLFSKYVKSIEGDYYNVMGLPISRLYQEIKRLERKYQISISTKK
jgi:septum formation protein